MIVVSTDSRPVTVTVTRWRPWAGIEPDAGDTVSVEIEGIGTLTNPVRKA